MIEERKDVRGGGRRMLGRGRGCRCVCECVTNACRSVIRSMPASRIPVSGPSSSSLLSLSFFLMFLMFPDSFIPRYLLRISRILFFMMNEGSGTNIVFVSALLHLSVSVPSSLLLAHAGKQECIPAVLTSSIPLLELRILSGILYSLILIGGAKKI